MAPNPRKSIHPIRTPTHGACFVSAREDTGISRSGGDAAGARRTARGRESDAFTEHAFILETWTEADTRPVVELHADCDALAARLEAITLEDVSAGLRVRRRRPSQDRAGTAKSKLDQSQVQRGRPTALRQVTYRRRATLSPSCVGLRLDRKGCSFPQSTAEIRSDQQAMTLFCKVSAISLRISAGQS